MVPLPGEAPGALGLGEAELELDRRGRALPSDQPPALPGAREFSIDRRSVPRERTDPGLFGSLAQLVREELPSVVERGGDGPIEDLRREPSLGGALRRLSEGPPKESAEDRLAEGRRLLAAGELELAFRALGEVLLARPLDPEPLKDLERIAAAMETHGELADLYARLLQENPNHPSLGTLTRRIGRLRAMVAMAPAASAASDDEAEAASLAASLGFELEDASGVEDRPFSIGDETGQGVKVERGVLPLPSEEEAGIRAAFAARSGSGAVDLGAALFGSDSEPAESIDYELGTLLTSGKGEELEGEAETSASEHILPASSEERDGVSHAGRPSLSFLLRRGAAFGVDAVLLGIVPLLILAAGTSSLSGSEGGFVNHLARNATVDGVLLRAAILLAALFAFIYCTLCWALGGRTLGGFIAGLRAVERSSGEALSVGRAALRAGTAVIGTAAFLVGPLWALVDPAGEALHDKCSGTSVISG